MQIPRFVWDKYIFKLSSVNKKVYNLMTEWIDKNGYDSIEDLIYWANGLTQTYGEAVAALACEMYDEIATMSGVTVPPAVPADAFPATYIAGTIYNLLNSSPAEIPNAVSRMVKQAGADTMLKNAQRDGAQFAWIPNGDTCAFCITLASRGWQYMSKNALKGGHAEHIHSNCDCEYAVRFDESGGVAGYDPQKYADMYYGADGDTSTERINAMRRERYAENKDEINAQKREAYARQQENK